jgi:hypothetical protein
MSSSEKIVLFIDMLGFTELIENYPIDIQGLMFLDRPLSLTEDDILMKYKNPLTNTFSSFHHSLKWAIRMAKMQHPITAITFSDSVFIATNYLYEAVKIAINLVQSMMSRKVPVRVGIAYGSFVALTFKSDISIDSGDHSSQFLGTAVVRAHLTESSGIKGIRILLHPSVIPLLEDENHNPASHTSKSNGIWILNCAEEEQKNKANIQFEINYWKLPIMKERETWKGLQEMWDASPKFASEHYLATAEAINRMRIERGKQPLNNLRRRTLPR